MKKLLLGTLFLFSMAQMTAQPFDREQVLEKMELANAYFMQKWPDVGKTIITNKERPSNIWTRGGVYYEGLMALYQICPRKNITNTPMIGRSFTSGVLGTARLTATQMIIVRHKPILTFTI